MALSKTIPTTFGVSASYWNISAVAEEFGEKWVRVVLSGFVSPDARAAGNIPLAKVETMLQAEQYVPDQTRAQLYGLLKASPDWSDAVDA